MDEMRKIRLDPTGEVYGYERCQRGGSWYMYLRDARSADLDQFTPEDRDGYSGLRLTLEDSPDEPTTDTP